MKNNNSCWLGNNLPAFALLILALFISVDLAIAENDISDRPLDVEFQAASTTVMFLLDDSGSMDSEQMTTDTKGQYGGDYYIFNYQHDYTTSIAEPTVWKTQWAGYNKIYYDPSVVYKPWQSNTTADVLLDNANMLNPLTHQYQEDVAFNDYNITFNLAGVFCSVEPVAPACDIEIDQRGESGTSGWIDIGCSFTVAASEVWQLVIERQSHEDAGSSTLAPGIKFTHLNGNEIIIYPNNTTEYREVGAWQTSSSESNGINNRYTEQFGGRAYYRPDTTLPAGDYRISYYENDHNNRDQRARFFVTKSESIVIRNSHYYLLDDTGGGVVTNAGNGVADSGEALYLVDIDGHDLSYIKRTFYQVANNDLNVQGNELTEISISAIPEAIRPPENAQEDLQNFANWFSFYSRRGLISKACVGRTIGRLNGLKIGLYSINGSVNLAALPVDETDINGNPVNTFKLLDALYEGRDNGNTPLRQGFRQVGEYYMGNPSSIRDEDGNAVSSPYETEENGGSCQQVYTIAMTDGYWTDSKSFDYDIYDDLSEADDPVHHDGISNTMADVAYYYYNTDLQSALSNHVRTSTCDNNAKQHMVTYGVSFGVTGTLNPDNYDSCTLIGKTGATNAEGDSVEGQYPAWPESMAKPAKIDDLWHAAAISKGEFFSANNPNELIESLNGIFGGIEAREISGSSVAVSAGKIYSTSNMYQASYDSAKWTGEVESYVISYDSGLKGIRIADTHSWKASEQLSELTYNSRKIITYNEAASLGNRGEAFRWAGLSMSHKNLLLGRAENDDSVFTGTQETTGENIVNYLRGQDNTNFRVRGTYVENEGETNEETKTNKLGDIVHSSPILIDNYIYVGANDGMLHVFDKVSGIEAFAYIPNLVFENLSKLIDENYQHKFFVDQTPTYAKIYNTESEEDDKYEKYLLGGLGKGGKGYYCLNITDVATGIASEDTAKDMVAWEFTDAQMGYSFSKPVVVKTRSTVYPHIVIVGNGYNSQAGEGVFYVLDLLTGLEITRFHTQVFDDNGVSSPIAIDVNNDYVVDYVYAGDLKGNLWKLDLTSTSTAEWDFAFFKGSGPAPLFTTMDNQPITSRPDVTRHCKSHGYLVAFGTGQYLGLSDLDNEYKQAMYAVWDYGDDGDDGECLGKILGTDMTTSLKVENHPDDSFEEIDIRVQMLYHDPGTSVEQAGGAVIKCIDPGGPRFATWELIADDDDPNENQTNNEDEKGNPTRDIGWFLPMSGFKERIVQDPMIISGTLLFLSKSPVPGVCSGGGFSMVYSLGICDGGQFECAWTTPDKKGLNMPVPVETPDGEKLIFGKDGAGEIGRIDKDLAGVKIPKGIYFWQEILED